LQGPHFSNDREETLHTLSLNQTIFFPEGTGSFERTEESENADSEFSMVHSNMAASELDGQKVISRNN